MKPILRRTLSSIAVGSALAVAAFTATATAAPPAATATAVSTTQAQSAQITREQVIAAQNAWGDALVAISTTHDKSGLEAATKKAEKVTDSAYGYSLGPVLFKPTLTVAPQTFRTTREGALAYFVGGNPKFANDTGFALKSWRSYQVENAAIFTDGDVAISMGNVRLTDKDGKVTVVDKTWGWKRGTDGNLRIVLHHSSLPYNPG
jgi:hypothetical protein